MRRCTVTKNWRAAIQCIVDRVLGEESYFGICPRDERGYCEPAGGGGGGDADAPEKGHGAPLPSKNIDWGFYGMAVSGQGDEVDPKLANANAGKAWNAVSKWLIKDFGASPAAVRAFLDSKWGRHMADAGVESDFEPGSPSRISVSAIKKAYARPAWSRELRGRLRQYSDPDLQ
jgi:hypothetical protein